MTKLNFLGGIVLAFALGGAGMWAYQGNLKPLLRHVVAQSTGQPQPHVLVGNGGSGVGTSTQTPMNAFTQVQHLQQQMNREMNQAFGQNSFFNIGPNGLFSRFFDNGNDLSQPGGPFGALDSLSGDMPTGTSIVQGEDSNSVYYKLKVGKKDLSNVKVNVDNGYVSIDARLQDSSSNRYSASTISERFPIPPGVDPNSAKITRNDNDVIIRFAKV